MRIGHRLETGRRSESYIYIYIYIYMIGMINVHFTFIIVIIHRNIFLMSLINSKNNKGYKVSPNLTPIKILNDSDNLPPVLICS